MKLFLLAEKGEEVYYKPLIELCKRNNVSVEVISYLWKYSTQKQVAEKVALKLRDSNSIILGFSLGALVALLSVAKTGLKYKHLILCSTTPLFFGTNFPKNVKEHLGKKRVQEAINTKILDLVKSINNTPVTVLVGENEDKEIIRQNTALSNKISKSYFINIKNTGHDIYAPEYLKEINSVLLKIK